MIIDKEQFKKLKGQAGGALGVKCTVTVKHEFGLELGCGEVGNMSVMNNGIYFDVVFNKKFFIPMDDLLNLDIKNEKLEIQTKEENLVFRGNLRSLIKVYNEVSKIKGNELTSKDEVKSKTKKENKELFEKIMATDPEVNVIENKETEISKRQIEDNIKSKEKKEKEELFEKIMATNPQVNTVKHKETRISKLQRENQRLRKLKDEHVPFCSKCHSTSVQYIERNKKLSVGRAITGGVLFGQAGAVLGGLSSKKTNGKMKCLNCGHEWKI